MEIRQVPVMFLSGQPDGGVLPLLSICCQWLPTGQKNMYIFWCLFVVLLYVHVYAKRLPLCEAFFRLK